MDYQVVLPLDLEVLEQGLDVRDVPVDDLLYFDGLVLAYLATVDEEVKQGAAMVEELGLGVDLGVKVGIVIYEVCTSCFSFRPSLLSSSLFWVR